MLMRAMRASHVEQWLPEIGKVDAVDSDRPISLNIFADVWLVDRSCEGIVLPLCGYLAWRRGLFRHREAAKESRRV
jgi:hypothetical protein